MIVFFVFDGYIFKVSDQRNTAINRKYNKSIQFQNLLFWILNKITILKIYTIYIYKSQNNNHGFNL